MFKITSFGELSGWRAIPMDMVICMNAVCPCDAAGLSVVCQMIQRHRVILPGPQVGACSKCGYVGYIDRPSQQWFRDFYASQWDETARNSQDEVRQLVRKEAKNPHPAAAIARIAKPSGKILEFGCGYGTALKQLADEGHSVQGVEPCQHRAAIAREEFGLDVHCGELSDIDGKYDLIFSSHVLEHCYDPDEVMRNIARLQGIGGKVMIAVPDAQFEPTMGQILFLPHLHSFTDVSLSNLFARHGYETVVSCLDGAGLIVGGVKTGRSVLRQFASDATVAVVEKFRRALSVKGNQLWWNSKNDVTASEPDQSWPRPRCIHIEACEPITGHPVEIQFEGPVQLCVK